MIYLSQRDPRWSQLKLGTSSLTVGRYGCTTTCISMLSDYFGCYVSPGVLSKRQSLYTRDGLIIWNNLSLDKMAFVRRNYKRDDAAILASLKDPNTAVILQVDNYQHWVVALRKTLFGNDYVILDPWTGKKATACGAYKNITGSAHFRRK